MRKSLLLFIILSSVMCLAQTTPPTAFTETTISFSLSPITLPGGQQTLAGAETDALINVSTNNVFGETTLISSSPFIGGRYERNFPSITKWLQSHTNLTGTNFLTGITTSVGVVKTATTEHWGERAGVYLKYAPAGSTNFNIGVDVEWNNLPGIAHNIPSISVGPAFRF